MRFEREHLIRRSKVRDWTTGEERLLLRLVDEQNTLHEIGAILNRSTESIRGKLRTIKSRDSISGSG